MTTPVVAPKLRKRFTTVRKADKKPFEELCLQSWWVVLFILICFTLYEQGSMRTDQVKNELESKLEELGRKRASALQEQEDLQLMIDSQADHAWRELSLMRHLGLVPEGQQKVYFFDNGES